MRLLRLLAVATLWPLAAFALDPAPSTTQLVSTNAPAATAPNAPTITVVPDKPGAIYQPGEKITWKVHVSDATPNASYSVKKAGKTELARGVLNFINGDAIIESSLPDSGTILAQVVVQVPGGKPVDAFGGAAVAPEKIDRSSPCPDDFDAFWKEKLAELAKVPASPVLEKGDSGKPGVDYWKISMDNIRGTHIRGQIARPAGDKKCPAMLVVQWAGVYPLQKSWVTDRAAQGWIALDINAHDIPIDEPPEYYKDQDAHALFRYVGIGNDDRETSYFLRMDLACSRAVDYLSERPDWDGKILIVTGGSQGGYQSFVAAALNHKITAMLCNVPAGCDHTGDEAGRAPGWPNWMAHTDTKDPKKVRDASRYYDAVNFAARVKCPALIGMGLIDTTSPPSGVFAAIHQLTEPHEVVVMPDSPHVPKGNQQAPYYARLGIWEAAMVAGQPIPIKPWPEPTH